MADGCAIASLGDTSVMVTAVAKTRPPSLSSFVPLTVDYREKAAAAGRIPTNYLRRELGFTEREILTSRIIDRSVRPLFPSSYNWETQLVCNLLAVDGVQDPDVISINAASAALAVSDIPWNGPVGAVRVGMVDNNMVVNPNRKEMNASVLNLVVVAADMNLVVMLDATAECVLQPEFLKAIKTGVKEAQAIVGALKSLRKNYGKSVRLLEKKEISPEIVEAVASLATVRVSDVLQDSSYDKIARDNAVGEVRNDVVETLKEAYPDGQAQVLEAFNMLVKSTFRNLILEQRVRCDGRTPSQLRPISCETDVFKPLHGSSIFQRGQTQVFCTVAFDSLDSALKSDPVSIITGGLKEKNFFLHYEFPPYATNETGRAGSYGGGSSGMGPSLKKHSGQLTSEVLESNGSSSMASICGGSLALMDAGVGVTAPAAGVAVGLVTKYEHDTKHLTDYQLLSDILGIEDYMGDMDFKLAGTKKGITALQADVKVPGLPLKVIMEAVLQGFDAKNEILDIMSRTISLPRSVKKPNWPVSEVMLVPVHKRAKFIGYGGRNIKRLVAETGVQVTQIDDTSWNVFAPNSVAMDEAKDLINEFLTEEREPDLQFGAIYNAKIVEVRDIGVMVTLYNNMNPALLHNSQLDQRKVGDPAPERTGNGGGSGDISKVLWARPGERRDAAVKKGAAVNSFVGDTKPRR
ncbi:Polyribonucleotide nucleotidyltransferase 1, mitochondrial [Orchesella cincta]|uniref:polyribonucleotide nucleotidyltransferase n=1 Tax=Orchesella cincta TaxID=48709 RepID=A0A1D2MIY6_ORCCI|nr:Polyribonucleotide nucleotidyltransferase 1, mitochondrial [Orchesella cincta]